VKYFVTGGAGFIGSNYVEMLLESIPDVSAVTIFDAFTYASILRNGLLL
jgi:dTDP-glucose 4,6-dehydratase